MNIDDPPSKRIEQRRLAEHLDEVRGDRQLDQTCGRLQGEPRDGTVELAQRAGRAQHLGPARQQADAEAVMEEVKTWQGRPLDAVYPIVYLDALVVKIRETGHVRNKAIYVVLGVNVEGQKEVLGLWVGQAEGAKFWLQVLTELKNRGVADVFIACVDGLKGFPEAIEAEFPVVEQPVANHVSVAKKTTIAVPGRTQRQII